jgi:general secretion pathway protein J
MVKRSSLLRIPLLRGESRVSGLRRCNVATGWRLAGASHGDGLLAGGAASSAQRGFTLIEVLLATALLALGLMLAFATLRAATATVERGELLAERSDRMRAVESFLRRRLASAQPIGFATDPGTGTALHFVGEPDRMRFVADLPDYLGRGGPHLHDIAILDAAGGPRLAVSFAMVLAGETVAEAAPRPPETLVPDLRAARFRYRGLDGENRLGQWTERWHATDVLPLQVSIEIETERAGSWPPMVVALPRSTGGSGSDASLSVRPGGAP